MTPTKSNPLVLAITLLALFAGNLIAAPLGTAFTYQGRLNDGANPATGIYDLRFAICDSASGGSVWGVLTNAATPVTNGLFTVTLDFGSGVFDGTARWLEIGVRTNGGGAFTSLSSRQALTPTPYAIQAVNATSAATATTAASVPASGIGPGTANINISGYAITAVSAASAGSAAVAATAVNFTGPLAGDVTGTQGATMVERVRGVPVSTNAPAVNQHLRFDGTRWVPAAVALGTDVGGVLAITNGGTGSGTKNFVDLSTDQTIAGGKTFSPTNDETGAVVRQTSAGSPTNAVFAVQNNAGTTNYLTVMADGSVYWNGMATGRIAGNGSGLTNLNAGALASGTLTDARLSTNVALLNANQTFTGSNVFSGVVTATNPANVFAGTFMGNGSGLASLDASHISSGTLPVAQLPGAVLTNNASGVNLNGSFSGDGAGVTNVNLMSVNSEGAITWITNWGNFVLGSSPDVGAGPGFVAVADVNGDGWGDLISANHWDNTLTVLTNNGGGVFFSNATYDVGSGPSSVVAADVNGDGWVDLICANQWDSTLSVLTNNHHGFFVLSDTPTISGYPEAIAAADVNGDGRVDLISTFTDYESLNTLLVLTNNGKGVFTLASSPAVGGGPRFIATADVNGDGWVDLICANQWDDTLSVLTNNHHGVFTLSSTPAVGGGPYSVAAADVNGDGWLDLISANYYDSTLSVLTNDGSGVFTLSSSPGVVGGNPCSLVAADVNGDGKVDLISADYLAPAFRQKVPGKDGRPDYSDDNKLTVLTNDGSGFFVLSSSPTAGSGHHFVAAADVNGDGEMDLICANEDDSTLSVFLNTMLSGVKFSGDGWGLTGLNPTNLLYGMANIDISGYAAGFTGWLDGDVFGTQDATTVWRIRGIPVAGTTPAANQVLRFNGTQWGPAAVALGTDVSGTLADARLSTNVALLNANQTFTGSNTFSGVVTATNPANTFNGSFTGNGMGLTNLNASVLASGALPDGRLSANVPLLNMSTWPFTGKITAYQFIGDGSPLTTLNASQLSSGTVPDGRLNGTYSSALTLNNAGNSFTGSGGGLQNLNANYLASGTLPSARLSGAYSSAVTFNNAGGNSFSGNGAGLTSLNANNLSSGTVPDGRLSSTYLSQVTFNNAGNNFTGNGSGLTSLNAGNLSSGFVPDGRLNGMYSSAVTFNNAGGNSFSGNGSGLTSLNANNLSSGTVPDARLSANVALLNGSPSFSTPVTMGNFLSIARTMITVTGNGMMITPTNSYVLLNSTGAYFLGGIFSGTRIGDVLILQGNSDVNTVQINNNANTKLTAANHVLGANDMLMLMWTGVAWTELSFANN